MSDGFRLALGTLTGVRVTSPTQMDRRTAAASTALAPVVGLVLGAVAELAVLLVRWLVDGWADRAVGAAVAVTVLAWLTRGIHWDGLAHTADALGSRQSGAAGLEVLRRSGIGAFGVLTLVLVLLLDVTALTAAILDGRGTLALVGGAVVGGLALTWTARAGVPAAPSDAGGTTVAASVSPALLAATSLAVAVALAVLTVLDDDLTRSFVPQTLAAAALAVVAAQTMVRRSVQRFGGITGHVMGAATEIAFCVFVLGVVVA
ncbi:MAG: adenosylcobinamide-GDP ribazoletransferase [Actinomycetota bacterium]|nr:adenosylcobinamide-GDP ribazoletransferase [Actinomycetota bacterium]